MICFCAERFHWRRIWQNPGELLLPGLSDMTTRALLYRRPYEPSTLLVKHGSQIFSVRLRRHRRARRYTFRIHPSDREAILTIPPRGTIADAKDLAPPHVLDYLAGHEVAHLVEMNHSARFWRVVAKICGHVERAKSWLDTHGNDLHRYGIQD